jgi:hypothetical protein
MTGSRDCDSSWQAAHRADTSSAHEVLHLVDEDRDAPAGVGRHAAEVAQQLDEVDLDVARVGPPGDRGNGDAGVPPVTQPASATRCTPPPTRRTPPPGHASPGRGPAPRTGLALRKGLDHTQHLRDLVRLRMPELAHRHVQRCRQGAAQRLIRTSLEFACPPMGSDRRRPKGVEQHGLSHPTQPGQHHGPLRAPPRHPFQRHVERVQLLVATGQLGGPLPRAGRVGIADRVHDRTVCRSLASVRDFLILR